MNILLIEVYLRILNMNTLMVVVYIHLVQLMSLRPTLPRGLRNESTVRETNVRRHYCVPKWREVASFPQTP